MMSFVIYNLPIFIIIAPLFVAFILTPLFTRTRLIENLVVMVLILSLLAAAYLAYIVLVQKNLPITYFLGGWAPPWGIELQVGNLGVFFLLTVGLVSLPIALFSVGNLEDEVGSKERIARFYVLFLLLNGVLAGMGLTNDMFNVFVLVEVATLSCCGLVSARKTPQAAEAAFRYLILATLGSTLILGGIGFIYISTGYLNMGYAFKYLQETWTSIPHMVWLAMSFILVGFGVKSAIFPLHFWLPDAHSAAPSSASALLSGLAIKGYMICLIKFLYFVFGINLIYKFSINKILLLLGMLAIIIGSIFAISQKELKRRLAYSTVAQVGYIFLGLGLLNINGLKGTLIYMLSHAIIKSTLFMAAGSIISSTGKKNIDEMAGIGRKMPVTMATFTIASLALVGLPLFSGFIGKWYLLLASLEAGNIISTIVIIIGSLLCAMYLFPIIRIAYFKKSTNMPCQDPGYMQKTALIILSILVLIIGIVPGPFLKLAERAANELLMLY